ncbi:hypothetical protein E8P82_10705 [Arthrobacter echini]|uniref:Uncharacterized protein n=1 Tax=Arthrobacter echini TaxID=1529066 RepID=A0A4S5E2X1_9MICC|nr:hypothetical protein [Arthrobacter echini]THJ65754.1 hypothetical protein E8P82_10705 [Arthrobacter echini]
MMNDRTATMAGWSIAVPEGLTSASTDSSTWWVVIVVGAILLTAVAVVAFGLISRRHRKEPLTVPTKEMSPLPKRKGNLAANSEWWTRTQWALEATLSGNEKLNVYGLRMLRALAKSEAADSKEKEVLDAVWQASSTRMQGDAIIQILDEAIKLKILPEVQENPRGSADAEAAGTPRRRYSPDRRDQVLSTLRLEILTAGLKVTLDQELGRKTSRKVKLLSELEVPSVVR